MSVYLCDFGLDQITFHNRFKQNQEIANSPDFLATVVTKRKVVYAKNEKEKKLREMPIPVINFSFLQCLEMQANLLIYQRNKVLPL